MIITLMGGKKHDISVNYVFDEFGRVKMGEKKKCDICVD